MSVHQKIDESSAVRLSSRAELIEAMRQPIPEKSPVMGEKAAPDEPAAVGFLILASYGMMLTVMFLGYAHGASATMVVTISMLYICIYLAVPTIFMRIEGATPMPLQRFLASGLETWTGHVSGKNAIIQILTIPVAITLALAAIATVAAVKL